MRINEERFGNLVSGLGFCASCPRRARVLAYMGEEDPVNVPDEYVEEGKIARQQCSRRSDDQ